jgi:hypothetical protein
MSSLKASEQLSLDARDGSEAVVGAPPESGHLRGQLGVES